MNTEIIDRSDFARYIGEPYTGNDCDEVNNDIWDAEDESNINFSNSEIEITFGAVDSEWFSEWNYRRRNNIPFIFTESDGDVETEVRLMSADEFYELLLQMKEEAETGNVKYRYF